eukprot:CAMPEP_0184481016 /NCGR_PEP_ID=MMETSP0113_2-20130426/2570_1 /TAXON_ID=91329 /ORGANISM="Norrisiella sphaerica, Strain BC52" /LENGTH=45 /DNA_ID= /DNA_START= /DNA_END= /DNA_ORIENTATION=
MATSQPSNPPGFFSGDRKVSNSACPLEFLGPYELVSVRRGWGNGA